MNAFPGSPAGMFLTLGSGIIALLGACATSRATSRAPADADVYYGFTLIDPARTRRVPNSWIVVANGRIAAVGAGHPPAADPRRAHDLRDRFVLPGFIDAHAHITATGVQKVEVRDGAVAISSESDDRITQHSARIALARGVTTR